MSRVLERKRTIDRGVGRTIDLSTTGLRFTAERPIEMGSSIELAVRWLLGLEGGVPLQLSAVGHVIRTVNSDTGVRIFRYEFRTQGKS